MWGSGGRGLEVPVLGAGREEVGTLRLSRDVWGQPLRRDVLQRVVRWQLARRQQGTHHTKTRAEVRGGGRKPWKQKGTGRARAGSIRAPHWRGGGTTFGPRTRSHAHGLQKKVRRLGLKVALSARAAERRVTFVESLAPPSDKTRDMAAWLEAWKETPEERTSWLLVDACKDAAEGEALRRVCGNLRAQGVEVLPQRGLNVYSLLRRDRVLITRAAAEALAERLAAPIRRF